MTRRRADVISAARSPSPLEDHPVKDLLSLVQEYAAACAAAERHRALLECLVDDPTNFHTATAAEFSFLLGLPTLGAATLYEGYKARHALAADIGITSIVIGLVTSFLVAWAVIAGFIAYLQRRGLEPFAYYRIVLGAVVLAVTLG